jgi:hypothetical protein
MRFLVFAIVSIVLGLASIAHAETLQAPVAGKPIALGESRVACPGTTGDWAIEPDGHAVRPPVVDDAAGRSVEAKVASSFGACSTASTPVTLVATGRWPVLDASATTLFVDDARVEVRGRGLRGVGVHWQLGDRTGGDHCVQPQADGGAEKCAVAVGRGLPADPAAQDLWWLPAGGHFGADVTTFDATGRRVSPDELLLRPARVVIAALVPPDVSIDLAGGTASKISLVHPEAVVGADCGASSCAVSGGVIVVGGLSSVSGALSMRLRLAPRVTFQHGDVSDPTPLIQVPVLPCAMSVASGEALRGVDATRVVVRVDPRCASEARTLRWFSAGRALDVLDAVDSGGSTFVLLAVGRVEGDEVVVTANRGGADASIVGQARARTRALPPLRATLTLDGGDAIDFVPTNRPSAVRWAKAQGDGELSLLPVDGAYDVDVRDGTTYIQGQRGAGGFVALRFAWRVPSMPGSLATADLASVADAVARPLHEASIPIALGASASGAQPIVEVLCGAGGDLQRVVPGAAAHVPFVLRDACRVIFHRERLSANDGAQHLQLDVDVARVDGEARQDAHLSQPILLRAAAQPTISWIKGVAGQFDRVTVRVTHTEASDGGREEPSVQYSIIFGTGHFRLYGTTSIPTGLYRVSDRNHSGILSLNFGVVMRATWLDGQGHEGFLGLEGGVMGVGLANDVSASGQSLTQVAAVTGLGISVPIANRSLATETSINLHAWLEYEVSRDIGGEPGNPLGFVFGPSISIGNIGTNF